MESRLDLYAFKARFRPALLVFLAPVLGLIAWFPERFVGWTLLGGTIGTFGLSVLLSEFARDLGKRKEPRLFALWGGPPTTRFLRHRDKTLNPQAKVRYHGALGDLIPTFATPTPQDEEADPAAADQVYEAWTDYLREATRDRHKFPLVFGELASYGFRRNLWAMKPSGTILCAIGFLVALGACFYDLWASRAIPPVAVAAAVIDAILLPCWIFCINPGWVRLVADAYGQRLLGACHILAPQTENVRSHLTVPPLTRSVTPRHWRHRQSR